MYLGNKIYPYILGNIDNRESVSSSHWNYYHKNFKFDKRKLNGLRALVTTIITFDFFQIGFTFFSKNTRG